MMMKLPPRLVALMLTLLPIQASAAQTDACMTREEARGFAIFILPDVVATMRDKCRATLPTNAYLSSNAASERFRADADRRWPMAKRAFTKMSGHTPVVDLIGEEASRKLLTGAIIAGIIKDVKPKSCAGVDRMLQALSPLPVENMDMLLDSFFLLGLGNDRKSGLKVCADGADTVMAPAPEKGSKR
jgi:hypothetical protein